MSSRVGPIHRPGRGLGLVLILLGLGAPGLGLAQQGPNQFDLTIANLMRGPEVYGREPQRPRFTPDGRWIYFSWLPPGTDWREPLKPYRVRAQPGGGGARCRNW